MQQNKAGLFMIACAPYALFTEASVDLVEHRAKLKRQCGTLIKISNGMLSSKALHYINDEAASIPDT